MKDRHRKVTALPQENAWDTGLHMEQKPDFTAAPQVAEAEQKGG